MTLELPGPLVSTEWLDSHLDHPDLRIVDGSWYLATMQRDARQEFHAAHLPGAVFWDLDQLSDQATPLPHMLADDATAARDIGALGIGNQHSVVVYDGSGTNLSAPRVWWTLRTLGHDRVAVLDGGIGKWTREARPLDRGDSTPTPAMFRVRRQAQLVKDFDHVVAAIGADRLTLLDARPTGRFEGRDPEPRPGLRGGHIPGAKNVPYATLVTADGTVLPLDHLRRRFEEAGVDLAHPVIVSCGSGVSACALAFGLELLGHREHAVYDGSWTEWGGRADAPVATGPA